MLKVLRSILGVMLTVAVYGNSLDWVDTVRYLGVYIIKASCCYDNIKKYFYGKVETVASSEV